MAQPVTQAAVACVGGVLPPGNVLRLQKGDDLLSGHAQERTDQLPAHRRDSAQAPQPAAPQKVQQHRFRVVVGGVGGGQPVAGQAFQKFVAPDPRRVLQAPAAPGGKGRHVAAPHGQLDAVGGAEAADKGFVPVRFGTPQAVVEMGGRDSDAESLP